MQPKFNKSCGSCTQRWAYISSMGKLLFATALEAFEITRRMLSRGLQSGTWSLAEFDIVRCGVSANQCYMVKSISLAWNDACADGEDAKNNINFQKCMISLYSLLLSKACKESLSLDCDCKSYQCNRQHKTEEENIIPCYIYDIDEHDGRGLIQYIDICWFDVLKIDSLILYGMVLHVAILSSTKEQRTVLSKQSKLACLPQ